MFPNMQSLLLSVSDIDTKLKFSVDRNEGEDLLDKLCGLYQSVIIFFNRNMTNEVLVEPMQWLEMTSGVERIIAENQVKELKALLEETHSYLDPFKAELLVRITVLKELLATAESNINEVNITGIKNFVAQHIGLVDGWEERFEREKKIFYHRYLSIISRMTES